MRYFGKMSQFRALICLTLLQIYNNSHYKLHEIILLKQNGNESTPGLKLGTKQCDFFNMMN